jgi:hypothetical protein
MSDGPHRTLPMKPRWKQVAQRAFGGTYSLEQVSESYGPALLGDWISEVRDPFVRAIQAAVIEGDQGQLFSNQALEDVQALRSDCRSPLEASLVDEAYEALAEGFRGQAAFDQAVENALNERLLRNIRQVEEHIHRERSAGRARSTRQRLEQAIPGSNLKRLAKDVTSGTPPRRRRAPKQDGIEHGPSI